MLEKIKGKKKKQRRKRKNISYFRRNLGRKPGGTEAY
jgi:hypothetical protein